MRIKCMFLKTQRIKSKSGNYFNLATFLYDGEIIKFIISDDISDSLFDIGCEAKVYLDLDFSIYRENLNLTIVNIELAS